MSRIWLQTGDWAVDFGYISDIVKKTLALKQKLGRGNWLLSSHYQIILATKRALST